MSPVGAGAGDAPSPGQLAEKVQRFYEEHPMDYLWVPVSGGKDSALVWALATIARVPHVAVFIHIPGQTHRDNVETVYRLAEKLEARDRRVVTVAETRRIRERLQAALEGCRLPCLLHVVAYTTRGEDYWQAMKRHGYPAPLGRFGRGTRWCCGVFKHRVLQRLPYNGTRSGQPWKYGMDGVKATDSPYRRKRYTSDVITWERTRDTYLFPLRLLTDEQVWTLLEQLHLAPIVKPQYQRWGRSPNCMFCPMIGRRSQIEKTVQAMTPAMRRLLKETLEELLPRYKPTTFSYRSITRWLEALAAAEEAPPTAAGREEAGVEA